MIELNKSILKTDDLKVIIIGAGPAGLTAAYTLSKSNVQSLILEKDNLVGGISRTVNYKGYYFDIGGHRFHTEIKEIERIWNEILPDDLLNCKRLSRIYYEKKYYNYPLLFFDVLTKLGVVKTCLIVNSYLYSCLIPSKEETLEQWISSRFGKRLFNTFFKTYSEKVWGIPCSEIMSEWAETRINKLSLYNASKHAILNLFNKNKDAGIKSLITNFIYPKYGPGMMWETVCHLVQTRGCKVRLDSNVYKIIWSNNKIDKIITKHNGNIEEFKGTNFISSMPIKELILKLEPCVPPLIKKAADKLRYRDFILVALIINKKNIFKDQWIYVHDPGVKVGRIQNFKNWSPHVVPDANMSCLGLEYFCFEGDVLWNLEDNELIDLGINELAR